MSTCVASSSRTLFRATPLSLGSANQTRSVIHHARPPRMPVLPNPHTPRIPSPTPGTSTPRTSPTSAPSSHTALDGTNLTFHHSPPPSAPSYITGAIPPFLRWVNGQSVHLTGEEGAPKRKERRGDGMGVPRWDDGVKGQMLEMRQRGASRKQIAKTLSMSPEQQAYIPKFAPLSPKQEEQKLAKLEAVQASWGFKKRLDRAKRAKRREFW